MNITDLPYNLLGTPRSTDGNIVAHPCEDDCSVLSFPGRLLITTTDFINSRPALLTLNVGTLEDVGYLSIIANLSDLLGTGARPLGCLVGVQLSKDHSKADYEQLMGGVLRCLDEYGVPLLGGDTKRGRDLSVYGVGIGTADSRSELFLSNRAKQGDPIWISGAVGAFNAAVYAITQNHCPSPLQTRCIDAILRPTLSLQLSRRLAETKQNRAGIDISDGLGADLARLATASSVGLRISSSAIPLSPLAIDVGKEFCLSPIKFAFATGGDFQFVVTGQSGLDAFRIGVVTDKADGLVLEHQGQDFDLPTTGHDDALMDTFDVEVLRLVNTLPI